MTVASSLAMRLVTVLSLATRQMGYRHDSRVTEAVEWAPGSARLRPAQRREADSLLSFLDEEPPFLSPPV